MVIHEKSRADCQINQQYSKGCKRGDDRRTLTFLTGLDCKQPLHELLVRPKRGQGAKKAIENGNPDNVGIREKACAKWGWLKRGPQSHTLSRPAASAT